MRKLDAASGKLRQKRKAHFPVQNRAARDAVGAPFSDILMLRRRRLRLGQHEGHGMAPMRYDVMRDDDVHILFAADAANRFTAT